MRENTKEAAERSGIDFLDFLRATAAVLVLLSHWRNLFYCDYAAVQTKNIAWRCFYFITGLGHESVLIFFVLSGFLIGNSVLESLRTGGWSWKRYSIARLSRLYTVLIPALLFTWLWDTVGSHLTSSEVYSGTNFGHSLAHPISLSGGFHVLAGNLLFLQGVTVIPYGTNTPLWSLANEFWYYVVFPFGAIAFHPGAPFRNRIFSVICGSIAVASMGAKMYVGLGIWLLGVGAIPFWRAWKTLPRGALRLVFSGSILGLSIAAGLCNLPKVPIPPLCTEVLLAFFTAASVASGGNVARTLGDTAIMTGVRGLAAISFSLYLLHMPFLAFTAALVFASSSDRWQPSTLSLLTGVGVLCLTLLYALAVYWLTERNTKHVKRFIENLTHV